MQLYLSSLSQNAQKVNVRKNSLHSFVDHCSQAVPVSCENAPSGDTLVLLANSYIFILKLQLALRV